MDVQSTLQHPGNYLKITLFYFVIIPKMWPNALFGNNELSIRFNQIFAARRYATAVYAVIVCPSVRLSVRLSVYPSVRLSITRWYCIKTTKCRITLIAPFDNPRIRRR